MKPGDVFEGTVLRPAFGGEVVVEAPDGRIAFLVGAAPGDRVRWRVDQVRKRFLRGSIEALLEAGATRVESFCPLVDRCGGCPWQRIAPVTQRAALEAHVRRGLAPAGLADVEPIVAVGEPSGWRSTARLHWRDGALGFHARGGTAVVDVPACPVLTPALAAVLAAVREGLGPVLRGQGTLRITAAPGARSGTVAVAPERPDARLAPAIEALVGGSPTVHGAVLLDGYRVVARAGEPANVFEGVPHPASGFVQAHRAGNAALVRAVVEAVGVEPAEVLELHAGSGNLTFALAAAGHRITAIEVDPDAVAALTRQAAARGLETHVAARVGRAERPPDGGWSIAVLDPPRGGAARAVAALASRRGLRRVVYVSCNPATLARDVRVFVDAGWRIECARPFDLFPHTGHAEVVCVLARGPGAG
jgi:23S rRNA (uracil1939-C5)-methyltransferase